MVYGRKPTAWVGYGMIRLEARACPDFFCIKPCLWLTAVFSRGNLVLALEWITQRLQTACAVELGGQARPDRNYTEAPKSAGEVESTRRNRCRFKRRRENSASSRYSTGTVMASSPNQVRDTRQGIRIFPEPSKVEPNFAATRGDDFVPRNAPFGLSALEGPADPRKASARC